MTEYPVRRVGIRFLCGRPTPDGGCQGVIAYVMQPGNRASLPGGFTEDSPGSHFWRDTARAIRRREEGQRPTWRNRKRAWRGEVILPGMAPPTPWRRLCPDCRCIAVVDVLD